MCLQFKFKKLEGNTHLPFYSRFFNKIINYKMSANPEGDANKSIEKRILEKLGDEELEPKEVSTLAHFSHRLTVFNANL